MREVPHLYQEHPVAIRCPTWIGRIAKDTDRKKDGLQVPSRVDRAKRFLSGEPLQTTGTGLTGPEHCVRTEAHGEHGGEGHCPRRALAPNEPEKEGATLGRGGEGGILGVYRTQLD